MIPASTTRARRPTAELAILVVCVAEFVDVMSVNSAVIALPDIRADLALSVSASQWVISAYALLFGSLLLLGGRLADRVGHRRQLVAGLGAFAAGSLVCALAPSGTVLVAARAASGAAAALTVPAALGSLVAATADGGRRRALGWWTAAGAGGGIAGLTVGGVLTDVAGWRAAFLAPGILAALVLPLIGSLPASRAGDKRPLDVAGAATAVGALALLLAGLASKPVVWPALGGAAVLVAVFIAIEARARWPLLERGLAKDRRLVAGALASAINTAATGPFAVLGAIYLQDVRGWSPAANGLSFVPFSAMVIAGSALGAVLLGRLGARRTLVLAAVPMAAAPLVSCAITADGGALLLIAARAVDGLGLGCAAVTATALGTATAARHGSGFAAGLINTATQLGTAIGIALLVPLASARSDAVAGIRLGFALSAAIAVAGVAAVLALLRRECAP